MNEDKNEEKLPMTAMDVAATVLVFLVAICVIGIFVIGLVNISERRDQVEDLKRVITESKTHITLETPGSSLSTTLPLPVASTAVATRTSDDDCREGKIACRQVKDDNVSWTWPQSPNYEWKSNSDVPALYGPGRAEPPCQTPGAIPTSEDVASASGQSAARLSQVKLEEYVKRASLEEQCTKRVKAAAASCLRPPEPKARKTQFMQVWIVTDRGGTGTRYLENGVYFRRADCEEHIRSEQDRYFCNNAMVKPSAYSLPSDDDMRAVGWGK